jgi:hypothetical protein
VKVIENGYECNAAMYSKTVSFSSTKSLIQTDATIENIARMKPGPEGTA